MDKVKWNNILNIGIEEIDNAHRKLFMTICRLIKHNEDSSYSRQSLQEEIKIFKNYTIKYFSSEELYMRYTNYHRYVNHKRLHDNLRNKIMPAFEKQMKESDYSVESIRHFLGTCAGWLIGHILIESRAITGYITVNGKYEKEDKRTDTLEQSIIHLMQEVFLINAHIVSKHYNVGDFDKGIYYRLNYISNDGLVRYIWLAFEECFLFHIFKELFGRTFHEMEETMIYAVRQLLQHLVKRIGVYFKSEGVFHLTSEDILTKKELAEEFEKESPPYSLLFDTENGHFAFCIK